MVVNHDKGMNSITYDLLFETNPDVKDPRLTVYHTIDIYNLTNIFTRIFNYKWAKRAGVKIELHNIRYSIKDKCYTYRLSKDEKIKFRRLSDCMKGLGKENIKEVVSDKRYHRCHVRALTIGTYCKNSKVLSGICGFDKSAFCHSIVLLEDGNVVDWTKNLIMDRKDYEKITGFREISSVNGEDLLELLVLENICPDLCLKPYLFFRDEIIEDMKKHKLLEKIES